MNKPANLEELYADPETWSGESSKALTAHAEIDALLSEVLAGITDKVFNDHNPLLDFFKSNCLTSAVTQGKIETPLEYVSWAEEAETDEWSKYLDDSVVGIKTSNFKEFAAKYPEAADALTK